MARRARGWRGRQPRRRGGFIRSIIRAAVVASIIRWVLRRIGVTQPKRAG